MFASTAVTVSTPTEEIPASAFASVSGSYRVEENLPNNGVGITNAKLLNSEVYVRVKKLGLGRALGLDVFPGGDQEMLDRIEIIGFELIPTKTVVTRYRINRIPTSGTTQQRSPAGVTAAIGNEAFKTNLLAQTVTAIAAEPASAWTTDAVFSGLASAPTDSSGSSSTSLIANHDASSAGGISTSTAR